MPEIRLGAGDNLPNIQLGNVQIEEVRLGTVLVWQNNQGPVFVGLVWDGTTFTVPMPFEAFSGDVTSSTGPFNGATGDRVINLVVSGISDPDNADPLADDYIIGYRLQRPDGTWAAGDPSSAANNSFGAPISDFGDSLPGVTATFDAATEEFTMGEETVASSTISVTLRDTDSNGDVVNDMAAEFIDDGEWNLFVVDSRGGQSGQATLDVTLNYQAPSGNIQQSGDTGGVNDGTNISTTVGSPTSYMNSTIGGPANTTLDVNFTGGPITTISADQYRWSCANCSGTAAGTGTTYTVPIPQAPGGDATPAAVTLTVLGRSWNGNDVTTRTTLGPAYLRSGASLTAPSYTYTGDGDCTPGAAVSGNWTAITTNTVGTFVSFNPIASGTWSGTCPACPMTASIGGGNTQAITETRTVSGANVTSPASTPSAGVRGANPTAQNTCTWAPSANPSGATFTAAATCAFDCTTCVQCADGSGTCDRGLVASVPTVAGGPAFGMAGRPNANETVNAAINCVNGGTITTAIPAATTRWPNATAFASTAPPNTCNAFASACTDGRYSFGAADASANIGGNIAITATCTDSVTGASLACGGSGSFSNTTTGGGSYVVQCPGASSPLSGSCTGTATLTINQTGQSLSFGF